jgi:hypothetical protein
MPKITIETESTLDAERMLRAGEAWGALWELTHGDLGRELRKREHEFKTPGDALDWVEKEINAVLEDVPVEEMNRNESGL